MEYPLCSQTVTIYHLEGDRVLRRVAKNCFLRRKDLWSQDEQGVRSQRKFLLIQPGEETIYPGDKILSGVGPEVTAADWEGFIPSAVAGLCVAAYTQPWYWQDKVCHWEAGNNG